MDISQAQNNNQKKSQPPSGNEKEVTTLAGGCFWCLEAVFDELRGVEIVESGYSGGDTQNPSYEQVCVGATGHAEVIQITFDPKIIAFQTLLEVFFSAHNPTTLNQQGADEGTQYRSAIFYHSPEQKAIAESVIKKVNTSKVWDSPVVTEVAPCKAFYRAEDYHQDYYNRNSRQSYCQMVISPKVAKVRKQFQSLLKK
ncbi:MAG: peptide-methionine (S)-S-oxide reductase MsrA [Planctomycetota bacterium]